LGKSALTGHDNSNLVINHVRTGIRRDRTKAPATILSACDCVGYG
jgi:hypothetical protein